jgi:3'-phosphoadenosine 5'-phosphosulfate sulfotransferase (PAPS reductase)/FAD synthetase
VNILSLGAGVQSSTLGEMANQGEIEKPDAAIFADTQWEPKAVYDWLEFLESRWSFPIYRVTAGNLRQDTWDRSKPTTGRVAAIPWHMKMANGDSAMGRRQCTSEYKIAPLRKKIVELMSGKRPKNGCILWIGISLDEATRMKDSDVQYVKHKWPLIELNMRRSDCLRWWDKHGLPTPPRSACIPCPFHNNHEWRAIKADPIAWADAVAADKQIRNQPKFTAQQFAHRSLVPLDEVDLSTAEERGQLNMFENECMGMCGV